MVRDMDPVNIGMDNLAFGEVHKDGKDKSKKLERNNTETISQIRSRKFTIESSRHGDKESKINQVLVTLPEEEDVN